MHIRKAENTDLPRILKIYENARAFMKENGNPHQWCSLNWPPEELVRQDIAERKSYVCEEDGQILGVFYFDHGHRIDPTYAVIYEGCWIGDEDYGIVHRIASDVHDRGVASFCIQWAYNQCGHLRMDTHGDNIPMQNLLKKLGFSYCGKIDVGLDIDRMLAYEKLSCPKIVPEPVPQPASPS